MAIALTGSRVEAYPIPWLALFAEAKGFVASNWGALRDTTVADAEIGASFSLTQSRLYPAMSAERIAASLRSTASGPVRCYSFNPALRRPSM